MQILPEIIAFVLGMTAGVIFVRYGIGLGAKIVERTKEGLPVFGRDAEPTEQSHTGDYEVEEDER